MKVPVKLKSKDGKFRHIMTEQDRPGLFHTLFEKFWKIYGIKKIYRSYQPNQIVMENYKTAPYAID